MSELDEKGRRHAKSRGLFTHPLPPNPRPLQLDASYLAIEF